MPFVPHAVDSLEVYNFIGKLSKGGALLHLGDEQSQSNICLLGKLLLHKFKNAGDRIPTWLSGRLWTVEIDHLAHSQDFEKH